MKTVSIYLLAILGLLVWFWQERLPRPPIGSAWVRPGHENYGVDSLYFTSRKKVVYIDSELSFGFTGAFEYKEDTLILSFKMAAFAMEDVTDQPYDRIEKYLVRSDSLRIIDLTWYRSGKMVQATEHIRKYNLSYGRIK